MTRSALLTLLLINFSLAYAADGAADLGNPEVEATVSVCSKEISTKYEELLNPPYRCGTLLAKPRFPLVERASEAYRGRFEHAAQQTYTETKHDSKGVRGMCELMALYCIEGNPKFTPVERQKGLEHFVEPPR